MQNDDDLSLTELRVPGGSANWRRVRWDLFIFRDVRDVLVTHDRDRVLVVHRGCAQPDRWRQALNDAGLGRYPVNGSRPVN